MCDIDIDAHNVTYTIDLDTHTQLPAALLEISFVSVGVRKRYVT